MERYRQQVTSVVGLMLLCTKGISMFRFWQELLPEVNTITEMRKPKSPREKPSVSSVCESHNFCDGQTKLRLSTWALLKTF